MAAGASYLIHGSGNASSEDTSSGISPKTISIGFGLWTAMTVSLALFGACLLAVKLSLLNSALLGAITGLVIWGTYFSLLVWISSTTVGSLIGSVVKTATSSFQSIVGTATAALGAKTVSNQVVATAEATAAAVRRELTEGLDHEDVKENLRDYIAALRSPEMDVQSLQREIERIVKESDLAQQADRDSLLQLVNRDAFVEIVESRTDLSAQQTQRTADRLYETWQRSVDSLDSNNPIQELVEYFKSAKPDQLLSEGVGQRLDRLTDRLGQSQNSRNTLDMRFMLNQGFNALIATLMGRTDLSDFDVDSMVEQVKSAQQQLTGTVKTLTGSAEDPSRIRGDVEAYLLNVFPWRLKQAERVSNDFRNVLYDASADAATLRRELNTLERSFFTEILRSRGLFTQEEIREIGLRLEVIRQTVLRDAIAAEAVEVQKDLYRRIETFLKLTPKAELQSEMGEQAFDAIVADDEATTEQLRDRFNSLNAAWFRQFLEQRQDLTTEDMELLINRYQGLLRETIADTENLQAAAQARLANQWQSLQDYLRTTNKHELNPQGIQRDLELLLEEPDLGVRRLRHRVSQFDRETLVALLSQRQDFSTEEIESVLDSVEGQWSRLMRAPQRMPQQLQEKARRQYNNATATIENYLRNTGKAELNPEGIKRDLKQLVEDPKSGSKALRDRLARMDRDTLVQLLSQRQDLSAAEINRTIDSIQESAQVILRTPRRLAKRAQLQAESFETALSDYLLNTGKTELHPEHIKRDLRILVNDPQLGSELLSERLSRIDRSTVVALLEQRKDMSHEEAEAAVNQIISVRDQMVGQVKAVQQRVLSAVNRVLDRIRQYLNSLEREELNYEGIRRDVKTLFDDPQAGFNALRDRLSQFDRHTMVALMSSHDRISQADAERVALHVEEARDSVLSKAERVERRIENQMNAMKLQTQQQFEATQKAAEAAAWWLFGTATLSAIASAVAGSLAVAG